MKVCHARASRVAIIPSPRAISLREELTFHLRKHSPAILQQVLRKSYSVDVVFNERVTGTF